VSLNPEVKEKWVAALRSGEYSQGEGVLKDVPEGDSTPKYCCLGVLCEIAVQEGVIKKVPLMNHNAGKSRVGVYLPRKVAKWAGLKDISDGRKMGDVDGTEQGRLATMNDTGNTFGAIADTIEEDL